MPFPEVPASHSRRQAVADGLQAARTVQETYMQGLDGLSAVRQVRCGVPSLRHRRDALSPHHAIADAGTTLAAASLVAGVRSRSTWPPATPQGAESTSR